MYILEPISKERIWGTSRLHEYSGEIEIDKIGSVYSASGITDIDCTLITNGKESTLGEEIKTNPEAFGLFPGEVYPLIISFTACDENLSIQVHPTDKFARENEKSPYGKSEAWYFISSPKEGWIYAEQNSKDINVLETAVKNNEYQGILNEYPVEKNELIYIPSGTIHALTKGSLVYEIQQSTDVTYRFYDYNRKDSNGRKRELHVDKALATIVPQQKVETEKFGLNREVCFKEFSLHHFVPKRIVENEEDIASVLTILSGKIIAEDEELIAGRSLILMPKEKIYIDGVAECIMAVPKRYW